jgi:hypothetical protein
MQKKTSNAQRPTSNVEWKRRKMERTLTSDLGLLTSGACNKFRLARLKEVAYDVAIEGGIAGDGNERKTIWLTKSSGKNRKAGKNLREKEGRAVPNPLQRARWRDTAVKWWPLVSNAGPPRTSERIGSGSPAGSAAERVPTPRWREGKTETLKN